MSTMAPARRESGWLTFAAVVLFAVAGLRLISGIAWISDSIKVADPSNGLFGDDLFWWGIWDLAIAVLAGWAGWSLLGNGTYGRVVGYAWAVLVIVQSFLIITWAPWFGAAMIALAVLVIYALAVTGEPDRV
jgi:hypothetical protein